MRRPPHDPVTSSLLARVAMEPLGGTVARGTPPKLNRVRDADGARRQAEFTRLTPDDVVRGPELPERIEWPDETRTLYESLRCDPVAQMFTPADWSHIVDTMALHRLMWTDEPSNAVKVAGEVRLRLAQLGVTPESRMRLRMLIDTPNTDEKPKPRVDADRKARLVHLVQQ